MNYEIKVPNNSDDEKHVYLSASDTTRLIAILHSYIGFHSWALL